MALFLKIPNRIPNKGSNCQPITTTTTKNIFQVSQVLPCHPPPNLSVLTQINKWIRSAWILNGFQYKFFYCLLQLIKYKAVTDLYKAVTDLYKAVMD